jgi:mannose/fructose/sorbose-specific phosphotransferase system IIA component
MINLVLVSHGDLAEGIVSAMHLIAGEQEGVIALSLKETDSIDELESRVETAIRQLNTGDGVLLMVDLFGASPFNTCVKLLSTFPDLQVVTGLNLPMLLETVMQREGKTAAELAKSAAESGKTGIKTLQELMDQAAAS